MTDANLEAETQEGFVAWLETLSPDERAAANRDEFCAGYVSAAKLYAARERAVRIEELEKFPQLLANLHDRIEELAMHNYDDQRRAALGAWRELKDAIAQLREGK